MRLKGWPTLVALAASYGMWSACNRQEQTVAPEPAPAPAPEPVVAEAPKEYPPPPPPGPARPVLFPDVDTFALTNGLVVHLIEDHSVPLVTAELVVRCGSMDEAYVAEFTADMLGEGTQTRSKARVDDAIEFVGGSLGSAAEMHVSYVSSQVLAKDLKLALTLVSDEILHPLFPEDALAKLKDQAKTALGFVKADPSSLADVLFDHVAYPKGHPYGRPLWTESDIDTVATDDIRRFHGAFYRSNNAFLILSGDVNHADAQSLAERVFTEWPVATGEEIPPNPLNAFTEYQPATGLVVHLVDRPGSAQTEVRVGNLAIARRHPDWPKLEVAIRILGGDPTSRLFTDLREERGLTYRIGARLSLGQAPGTFEISTSTRTESTGDMLVGILQHVRKIRTEAPSDAEVKAAIAKIIGSFPLAIETPRDVASKVRESLIYNLPADYWKTYRDTVAAVDVAGVQEAARKYIHGAPHVVLVGEAEAIIPQLEKVLPTAVIKQYDGDLKPK